MILECYCTGRFHDSYYLQRCTHLCLQRINPVNLKVLVRETLQNCIICRIRGIPQQSVRLKCRRKNIQALLMLQ